MMRKAARCLVPVCAWAFLVFAAPPAVQAAAPLRYANTSAASSHLAAATTLAQAQSALQECAAQYGMSMLVTPFTPSSFADANSTRSFLAEADLGSVKQYGQIFLDEWSKYPKDWVTKSNVKSVALVKNLKVQTQTRASMPDTVGHTMYYDVGYLSAGERYNRQVLHHEYDHLIEYNYFGSWAHTDTQWTGFNDPAFTYGHGGGAAYSDPAYAALQHPQAGFVTGYATSAIEEDKAETYAYMMTTSLYLQMLNWLVTDPILNNKIAAYSAFITSKSPTMNAAYFNAINPAPPKLGDINNDGVINIFDLSNLLANWGATNKPAADLDKNGTVNIFDLSMLLARWGS